MGQKAIGVIGRKCGMTQVFTDEGIAIPVTVVAVKDNVIIDIKTASRDGYSAILVKSDTAKPSRVNKPLTGVYRKAEVEPGKLMREFLCGEEVIAANQLAVGVTLTVEQFQLGQHVDVAGTSKGKGFQGGVKRHNFRTQDATHGNSLSHRVLGSTGQNQSPGRVFKGKKMAGQMGNTRRTIQNLEVIRIDTQRNLLLIKGSVPGHTGCNLIVKPAIKKPLAEVAE
jgi:large subunit ribosomal protein L3